MDSDHPIRGQRVSGIKVERSRELRKQMTEAERVLWEHLRGSQLRGLRFRRQQILCGFIVDFYCHPARLVIEVDGSVHDDQEEYDGERDTVLAENGFGVLRFRNEEVMKDLASVLKRIDRACGETSPPTPLPQGEGRQSGS